MCLSLLLYQKEGREALPHTRLPKTERTNYQKLIPPTPDPRPYHRSTKCMDFYEVSHQMGIQQCTNQRRGRTQGGIQNQIWTLWTKSHVLWINKLPCHIPSNDKQDPLRDLREKYWPLGVVISGYMDDYLIATSSSIDLHWQATHNLLDLIKQHDLFIKPEKCIWEAPHVDYLELILEKGVVHMDPAKIAGVTEWPIPTTVKQVRSFLGFCNYYCPFVPKFSHVARPLND